MSHQSNYPLNQSPLYKLRNKRKLASYFDLSLKDLNHLIMKDKDNYRVFQIKKDSVKARTVETPKPILERIHRKLFNYLRKIDSPIYLHSGVKSRSYITNARTHIGSHRLLKIDIEKFFPSTKKKHVYNFFYSVMKCESDVAGLLSEILTIDGHLPTGSCISQIIAFYSHYEMFQQLYNLSKENNINMTCYVDDIVFSGMNVSKGFQFKVSKIIKNNDLNIQKRKTRLYGKYEFKLVTGVIVNSNEIRIQNCKHHKVYMKHNEIKKITDVDLIKKETKRLNGMIASATCIDPQLSKLKLKL